jgi:hypothetical protein
VPSPIVIVFDVVFAVIEIPFDAEKLSVSVLDVANINEELALIVAKDCVVPPLPLDIADIVPVAVF